ncbi:unnamed protein product, partial [Ostreobium quekettii]
MVCAGAFRHRPMGRCPPTPLAGAPLPAPPARVTLGDVPRGLGRAFSPRVTVPRTVLRSAVESLTAPSAAKPGEEDEAASQDETFQWTQNWYPIIPLDLLEESQGQGFDSGLPQIQRQAILGRDIVLWKDAEGKWRAVEDRCSHRLAALSLGSVQEDGTLACRYHGWCFNGKGECTRIPQAVDAASEATACASSRSSVQAFPTLEAHGLLWVWPDDGPSAWEEASSAEPVVGRVQGPKANWGVLDLPVSYITSVENVVDPSHGNFVHEGLTIFGSKFSPRQNRPIDMFKALRRPSAKGGIQLNYTAPSKDDNAAIQTVQFRPPTLTSIQFEPGGMDASFELLWVPLRPGLTRTLVGVSMEPPKASTETKASILRKVVSAMKIIPLIFGIIQTSIVPKFLMHIYQQNYINRQDMMALHSEDLELF